MFQIESEAEEENVRGGVREGGRVERERETDREQQQSKMPETIRV